jgi:hypothetical protein
MVGEDRSGGADALPKPRELLALGPVCERLFDRLRVWFDVGPQLVADLSSIDGAAVLAELQDPQLVAGFTMRRLQALHLLSRPGVPTATDVVVGYIDAVLRPLVEAPGRHMRRSAAGVDWDRAWEVLDAGMLLPKGCPEEEAVEFRRLVGALIAAREAVLDASDTGVCVFS